MSTTITLGAAVHAAQSLQAFENGPSAVGTWAREVDAYIPGGIGVVALAKESGVAKANVSRYAAAGCLLNALDTLPGDAPKACNGQWALKAGREAKKGGITGPKVRTLVKSAKTAGALAEAINDAMGESKKAHAAELKRNRTPRPNDGTDDGGTDGGTDTTPTLAPDAEILAAVREVSRRINAGRKADLFAPGNVDRKVWSNVADAADAIARNARAIIDADDAAAKAIAVTPADVAKVASK